MSITLGDVIIWIKPDDSKLDQGLRGAEQKTRGWAGRVGGFLSNAASFAVGGFIQQGVSAITGSIGGLASEMINSNAAFEQYETRFETLLGSTDAAKERMADLAEFGAKTPFELPGVVEADIVLQGFGLHSEEAAKKFGFSGEQIRTIAGDVASGTGSDFKEMALLIGKFSAGATGEAISRMMELGITNRDELAKMGLEFSKSGQLLSPLPESMNVVLQLMQDKYGGLMDAQSSTFEGMMSNLQDWKGNLLRTLGAPIFEVLKDKLGSLLEFLSSPEVMASIDKFAQMLANGIGVAMDWLNKVALPALQRFGAWFMSDAMPIVGSFVDFIRNNVIPIIQNFVKAIITAPGEGGILLDYLQELPSFLQPIATMLANLSIWIVNDVIPALKQFGAWFISTGLPILKQFAEVALGQLSRYLATAFEFIQSTVLPLLERFGAWFINEGLPRLLDFASVAIPQLLNGLQQLATWVVDIAEFVLPLLSQAFQFLTENVLPFLIDHFNIIGPILGVIGAAILALTSPVTFIIGLIILLATAWANNWGGVQEKTQAVMDFIVPKIQWAMNLISSIVSSVLGFIQAWWQKHGDAVITVINFLWNTLVTIFKVALGLIMYAIQGWILLIQSFWQNWGDTIMAITRFIWETIQTIIKTALEIIGYVIDAAAALIRGDWSALGDALQNIWSTAWSAIQKIVDDAKETLKTAVENIKTAILGVWDGIKASFESIGDSIVQGIKDGIDGAWDSFVSWLGGLVGDLIDSIKKKFGIGSPSLVFRTIGENLMSGLALGIEQNQQLPARAMTQTTTTITQNFYQTINTPHVGNLSGEFQQMRALLST